MIKPKQDEKSLNELKLPLMSSTFTKIFTRYAYLE